MMRKKCCCRFMCLFPSFRSYRSLASPSGCDIVSSQCGCDFFWCKQASSGSHNVASQLAEVSTCQAEQCKAWSFQSSLVYTVYSKNLRHLLALMDGEAASVPVCSAVSNLQGCSDAKLTVAAVNAKLK